MYVIFCMFACSAGSSRPVRRQVYPPDSPPAVGVMWQWSGDTVGHFHPYSIEVSALLEKGHRCGASSVDLNRHPFYLPYVVRLSDMMQVRNGTNYSRRIQRVLLPQPYMPTSINFSSHASVSPLPTPVFQFGHATAHPTLGFPSVDPGSLFFPSLFQSPSLSLVAPQSGSASAPAVGSSWGGGGLHGGSDNSAVASPFMNCNNAGGGQTPFFTIGRSAPSSGMKKRKRVLVRDLTPGGR